MATIQLSTEGTGPLINTVTVGGQHRQIVVVGDVASTAAGTTGVTVGSVALLAGTTGLVGGVQLVPGSTATTLGSVSILGGATGNLVGYGLISTGSGGAAVDPRQATIVGATSGAGLGTILSTAAGSAAIDPRIVTPSSQWTVSAAAAASTVYSGVVSLATSTGATIIDPRILYSSGGTNILATTASPSSDVMAYAVRPVMGSTATTLGSVTLLAGTTANAVGSVALLGGTTANSVGSVALLAGTTGNAIGSVALLDGSSANSLGRVLGGVGSTGGTLTTVGWATANLHLPVALTTDAFSTTIIDPRVVTPSSQWTITNAPAGSTVFGMVVSLATSTGATIIDPRILYSSGGTNILATTASPSSDVMAYAVRPVMGSSATILGSAALLGGTTANSIGSVALLGGTTANVLGSVALIAGSSANTVGAVANVAATTGIMIGAVTLSSGGISQVYGDISTGSTAGANPLGMGIRAAQTNPTAGSDGARLFGMGDDVGRQVVRIGHVRDLIISTGATLTSTAEVAIVAAAGAGVFSDISHLRITHSSTSNIVILIRSSSGSATTYGFALAGSGGITELYAPAWVQATANSAWTAELQAAGSTVYIGVLVERNI